MIIICCLVQVTIFSQKNKRGTITVSKANNQESFAGAIGTGFSFDTLPYFKSEIIETINEFNKTPDDFKLNIFIGGNKVVPKVAVGQ